MSRSSRFLNLGTKSPLSKLWTRVHADLYRRTGGRFVPRWFGGPVMVLEVKGRKSGQLRRVPVMKVEHGDGYVVIPSNAGSHKTPAWWLNLQSQPQATIQVDDAEVTITASAVADSDRAELWQRLSDQLDTYDGYQQKVSRQIDVVRLRPVDHA